VAEVDEAARFVVAGNQFRIGSQPAIAVLNGFKGKLTSSARVSKTQASEDTHAAEKDGQQEGDPDLKAPGFGIAGYQHWGWSNMRRM
jgi:hypothetical protein